MEFQKSVLGPPHCEEHITHHIGCLNCAAEVCAADNLDIPEFFNELRRIGWRNFEDRIYNF